MAAANFTYGNPEYEAPAEGELATKEQVTSFFTENKAKYPKWDFFRSGSRCAGFTLCFGAFAKANDLLEEAEENDEDPYEEFQNILEEHLLEQSPAPELKTSRLPCCWGRETGFNAVVGFNVVPLIWRSDRNYINIVDGEVKLEDVGDSWFIRHAEKNEMVKNASEKPLYKLPDEMARTTKYILDTYCAFPSWKQALYLSNYSEITWWKEILDQLYADEIARFSDDIKVTVKEIDGEVPELGWCFYPSDCASCS